MSIYMIIDFEVTDPDTYAENVTKWLTSPENMPLGDLRKSTVSRAILVEGCRPDGRGA